MKSIKVSNLKKSRRSFFKNGILAGLAAFFSSNSNASSIKKEEDTVKLLTSDGKLVEVQKKHLPQSKRGIVSNKDLFKWKFKKE